MHIRYDDMRIDRLLIKEYQSQLELDLKRIRGLNDIDILLQEFEGIFARYIGTRYAIAVNSGMDALQLSLLALGIGKGDSVIMPDVTYPAVPLSVMYAGAEPIFIDINKEDLQIDEGLIEKRIQKNTRAIIAVHMFGRPCNISRIIEIARKRNLRVIEDVCQAESSEYCGKKLGSFADLSCFSFSYYKPLSSCGGGGGMVCFNEERFRNIIDYTRIWGDNEALLTAGQRFARMYLLDLISVKVKFKYLQQIIKSRLKIKKIYEEQLCDVKVIAIMRDGRDALSVPQNFVIFSEERDVLGNGLEAQGVRWQRPYNPLHSVGIFKEFSRGSFPRSSAYFKRAIQLPLFSFMDDKEALYICGVIKKVGRQTPTT